MCEREREREGQQKTPRKFAHILNVFGSVHVCICERGNDREVISLSATPVYKSCVTTAAAAAGCLSPTRYNGRHLIGSATFIKNPLGVHRN